jgi:hypothetical protein
MITIIIGTFILTIGIGLYTILNKLKGFQNDLKFAFEYRDKYVSFANTFLSTYNQFSGNGTIDNEKYIWLTKYVTKIQSNMGQFGIIDLIPPFQTYHIKNYQLIVNSIPKFRAQNIDKFEINSTDDSLLRYIGNLEEIINQVQKKIKNPIIWFQEGIQSIISLPLHILSWFGIISKQLIYKVKGNIIFKLFTGITGLIAFISGIITIIVGKDEAIEILKKLFHLT